MTYVEGFVIPVPTARREDFTAMSGKFDAMLVKAGALRVVECWGVDVPPGKVTDFFRAVQAGEDETVAFSWIEWPDKETRDRAHASMAELMETPEMKADMANLPFDGKRMIFGGFTPVVDLGGQ